MCGPIVVGLGSYAAIGAGAGLVGEGLPRISSAASSVMAAVLGAVVPARALGIRLHRPAPIVRIGARASSFDVLVGRAMRVVEGAPPIVFGAVLALLPRMIALWALGLAALTASSL